MNISASQLFGLGVPTGNKIVLRGLFFETGRSRPRLTPPYVNKLALPLLLIASTMLLATGCDRSPRGIVVAPMVASAADSVAFRLTEALGGHEAWASLPYLRFDFARSTEGKRSTVASHFWSRHDGRYRVEWANDQGTYVALFNVNTREGEVFLDGEPVAEEDRESLLNRAYGRYINDTYWMLAPTKVFDEGVTRTLMPDSSDGTNDVIRLSFQEVGLTPGDQYWLYVDRESGKLQQWAFILQNNQTGIASYFDWTDYKELKAPRGTVRISTRKQSPAGAALLTDRLEAPRSVPDGMFEQRTARLLESGE
jgi:hypothetical protein